jgi:hypothetical protein
MKKRILRSFAAGLATLFVLVASASAQTHVITTLTDARWGPAPPMLPPGAQIAVLAGDPSKPAPYTVRLKFPANYFVSRRTEWKEPS